MTTSELREICQKGSAEPFLISKYLYRPFTIFVTRLYILCGLSSNTATLHSLIAGLVAAGLALSNSTTWLLWIAICIQIYVILDHVDGELARYRVKTGLQHASHAGAFFDLWTHLHTYNLVYACMGIGLFRQTDQLVWAVLGLVACNIAGSYQWMGLATVLMGAISRRQVSIDDPAYLPVLRTFGAGNDEAASTEPPSSIRRILRIGAQFIIFPGNLLGITLACVGDHLLGLSGCAPAFVCRATFLVIYCTVGLVSKVYRTRTTIRQLQAAGAGD